MLSILNQDDCSIFHNQLNDKVLITAKMPLTFLNPVKKGSKTFPYGLRKTIPKDAKRLQIKSLQPFFIASKHHIMHQNATKMSVIRCVTKWKITTHRITYNQLNINLFSE